MSKRKAVIQLTQENWEDEEPEEESEPGVFAAAAKDALERRPVKVAKRRFPKTDGEGGKGPSVFAGFAGFAKAPAVKKNDSNGSNNVAESASAKLLAPALSATLSSTDESSVSTDNSSNSSSSSSSSSSAEKNPEFLRALQNLNEAIISFAQHFVSQNPYVDLTPTFSDYVKHYTQLAKRYSVREDVDTKRDTLAVFPTATKQELSVSKQQNKEEATETKQQKTEQKQVSEKNEVPIGGFVFGNTGLGSVAIPSGPKLNLASAESAPRHPLPLSGLPTTGFRFGTPFGSESKSSSFTPAVETCASSVTTEPGSTGTVENGKSAKEDETAPKPAVTIQPFGFFGAAAAQAAAATTSGTTGPEEEQVEAPPKVEVVEFEEEGSVYSIRCKLYFMKDSKYVEKGVGTLYLKPQTDTDKTQLLVRAGTSTGNVLLNILLDSKAVTCERKGKNNVSLVCVPNPPLDPKHPDSTTPVPMLIRVKTPENAESLFDNISKHTIKEELSEKD